MILHDNGKLATRIDHLTGFQRIAPLPPPPPPAPLPPPLFVLSEKSAYVFASSSIHDITKITTIATHLYASSSCRFLILDYMLLESLEYAISISVIKYYSTNTLAKFSQYMRSLLMCINRGPLLDFLNSSGAKPGRRLSICPMNAWQNLWGKRA